MTAQPSPLRLDAAPSYAAGMATGNPRGSEEVRAFSLPEMLAREPGRLARHYHSFFQSMLLSGDVRIEIDGRESRVTSHSLALIYPACIHRLTPSRSFSGTSISFSPGYFERLLDEMGVCGNHLRQRRGFPLLRFDPQLAGQINETVATIQFEFDRSLARRDLLIRECLKLLLIRACRLSQRMI